MANDQAIGIPKPVGDGVIRVTWENGTEWSGDVPLIAKSKYVLGEQSSKAIQPAGDYLTEEDFDSVEVLDFRAEKIGVKDGGTIELNQGSSIVVTKGINEGKVVVIDGETTNELTFPAKDGTLAVVEDIPEAVQPDWEQTDSSASDFIKNKPDIDGLVDGVVQTWEDSLGYGNQASNQQTITFKPRVFGMSDGDYIKSISIANSRTVSTNKEVFAKLISEDGLTVYATSDSQNMTTSGQ